MNELRIFGKRMARDDDIEVEEQLFRHLSQSSLDIMKKVMESSRIYSKMYQLSETYLMTKFVKSEIVDEEKKLFTVIRADLEEEGISSYLEYFVKVFKISRIELLKEEKYRIRLGS